jgi:hypothetical protein
MGYAYADSNSIVSRYCGRKDPMTVIQLAIFMHATGDELILSSRKYKELKARSKP